MLTQASFRKICGVMLVVESPEALPEIAKLPEMERTLPSGNVKAEGYQRPLFIAGLAVQVSLKGS